MGRRLSDAEIIERYRRLQSAYDVSLEAGCSSDTVLKLLRAAGEPVRKKGGVRGRHKTYALTDEEICTLYRQGMGTLTLADRAGTNASQIRRMLMRCDVPIRSSTQASAILRQRRRQKTR